MRCTALVRNGPFVAYSYYLRCLVFDTHPLTAVMIILIALSKRHPYHDDCIRSHGNITSIRSTGI